MRISSILNSTIPRLDVFENLLTAASNSCPVGSIPESATKKIINPLNKTCYSLQHSQRFIVVTL